MFPKKYFSSKSGNQRNPSIESFERYNLELYPRRRLTEFYYEKQPQQDYHSRQCEHVDTKLQNKDTEYKLYTIEEEPPQPHINPPRNSDMRLYRNSYFS